MSPPTLTLISWGFWPIACLTSTTTSLSFFTIHCIALITLFGFTKGEASDCVKGPLVCPTNYVGLLLDTCIHGPWYCALPDCAITHGGGCIQACCCIHVPVGDYRCHYLVILNGRTKLVNGCGMGPVPSVFGVIDNLFFLSIFVVDELTTTSIPSCTNSTSSSMASSGPVN